MFSITVRNNLDFYRSFYAHTTVFGKKPIIFSKYAHNKRALLLRITQELSLKLIRESSRSVSRDDVLVYPSGGLTTASGIF
jgi:hypothetical protein